MKLVVDTWPRYAKQRAHTSTHLLHSQLADIFPNTKQSWSLVDEDLLRFDFVADRLLTTKEISQIEKNINQIIFDSLYVESTETSMDEAVKLWAKAFFEDKYGDKVRVVQVKSDNKNISAELCGWTHVANTVEIWCFAIVSQEAVAAGIKRISAVTWPKVSERIQEVQWILDNTLDKLWIKTYTQLWDKLDKVLKEYEDIKTSLEIMEAQMVLNALKTAEAKSDSNFDKIIKLPSNLIFKNITFHTKSLFPDTSVVVYNEEWNFVMITKPGTIAKDIASQLWIKWWWNENMVQGRDPKILEVFK